MENNNIKGEIGFSWTITSIGSVKNVKLVKNKTGDKALGKCFISTLKSLKFPSSGDRNAEVEYYPFSLK
jgi:hypothetical protein